MFQNHLSQKIHNFENNAEGILKSTNAIIELAQYYQNLFKNPLYIAELMLDDWEQILCDMGWMDPDSLQSFFVLPKEEQIRRYQIIIPLSFQRDIDAFSRFKNRLISNLTDAYLMICNFLDNEKLSKQSALKKSAFVSKQQKRKVTKPLFEVTDVFKRFKNELEKYVSNSDLAIIEKTYNFIDIVANSDAEQSSLYKVNDTFKHFWRKTKEKITEIAAIIHLDQHPDIKQTIDKFHDYEKILLSGKIGEQMPDKKGIEGFFVLIKDFTEISDFLKKRLEELKNEKKASAVTETVKEKEKKIEKNVKINKPKIETILENSNNNPKDLISNNNNKETARIYNNKETVANNNDNEIINNNNNKEIINNNNNKEIINNNNNKEIVNNNKEINIDDTTDLLNKLSLQNTFTPSLAQHEKHHTTNTVSNASNSASNNSNSSSIVNNQPPTTLLTKAIEQNADTLKRILKIGDSSTSIYYKDIDNILKNVCKLDNNHIELHDEHIKICFPSMVDQKTCDLSPKPKMDNIMMFHKPHGGREKEPVLNYIVSALKLCLENMGITAEFVKSILPEKKKKKSNITS